ncbi:MAG: hypothetical protein H9W81_01070 [Enterococcus sp.]|nr:hypothetical protein [Enterococcus sp.]
MKALLIAGVAVAGTLIASSVASALVEEPKPVASFTPEEWSFYKNNWPKIRTT